MAKCGMCAGGENNRRSAQSELILTPAETGGFN